ncbi:MAG: hypothetical protein DWI28_02935 [Planctomycetota bacterium]|nr:MAG: hypothetical protein DWI28_02935 [Planctomycetota bacterium]
MRIMDKDVVLPEGNKPKPVLFPHFPSMAHAVVWRNWDVVRHDRIAAALHTTLKRVNSMGAEMGLPEPLPVSANQAKRLALTVIRRNWHLLPYDQLLILLKWTAKDLEFTLREDDFFYIKLGSHKPECPPVRVQRPTKEQEEKCKRLRAVIDSALPEGLPRQPDPLLAFVERLSKHPAKVLSKPGNTLSPRYCYSYFALYGDPFLEADLDPYPDGYVAQLVRCGVDGVWLQAVLHKLTPFPWEPQRSEKYEQRLEGLARLTTRLAKHGVKLWLYINEPRSLPNAFYVKFPQLKGVTEGDWSTMCTLVPEVRTWLKDSIAMIAKAAPDLGGFFTISGSENLTHCWSHGQGAMCPRCSAAGMPHVVADLHSAIDEGIEAVGGKQRLIAWDWGWPDGVVRETIANLSKRISVMSVSEWDTPIHRGGIASTIGEYSITVNKPGPRATRHWKWATDTGHQTIAKMQAANSWEMSAVPYVPAVRLTAEHADNIRVSGVRGIMLGWTLGGYPSPNLEAVSQIGNGLSVDNALMTVASRRNGKAYVAATLELWNAVSHAMLDFPFHITTVYQAPLQQGVANPLWLEPTGYRSTMSGFGYDDVDGWRAVYPPDIFASQLTLLETQMLSAVRVARPHIGVSDGLEQDIRYAEAAAIIFGSVADQTRFYILRKAGKLKSRETRRILDVERGRALRLITLQAQDACIGFEASNQYYFVRTDLLEKIINLADIGDRLGI